MIKIKHKLIAFFILMSAMLSACSFNNSDTFVSQSNQQLEYWMLYNSSYIEMHKNMQNDWKNYCNLDAHYIFINNRTPDFDIISYCQNKTEPYATEDTCYNKYAQNILECSHISDPVVKNQCYVCVAVYNNNSDLCESISGTKDVCYRELGGYSGDLSKCARAGTLKDACTSDIATRTGNYSICSEVNNLDMKNSCYYYSALFNYDFEICNNIAQNNRMKDTCYYNVAINKNNTDACENIKDLDVKRTCSKLINLT